MTARRIYAVLPATQVRAIGKLVELDDREKCGVVGRRGVRGRDEPRGWTFLKQSAGSSCSERAGRQRDDANVGARSFYR